MNGVTIIVARGGIPGLYSASLPPSYPPPHNLIAGFPDKIQSKEQGVVSSRVSLSCDPAEGGGGSVVVGGSDTS